MIGTMTNIAVQSQQAAAGNETIDTRFGQVQIARHSPIVLARGPLGMPDKQNFCITEFPSEKMRRFKLFQSLDDLKLSFITLPIDINNPVVTSDDMAAAANDLGIKHSDLATLLIVSVHRNPMAVKLSVNARAPVFIDSSSRQGMQYVFPHERYRVQHFITT